MPPAKKTTKTEGPKYSELIKAALLGLKERNGSSLAAIKKYMATNFPAAKACPQPLPPRTRATRALTRRARAAAERPGAQERAQVRRLQGHVHQGQGVLQALTRGQGELPPTAARARRVQGAAA